MCFAIQASNPTTLEARDDSTTLSDAIESVFPLNTEDAILKWNYIFVPLGYKYDMCLLIDDVLNIITEMHTHPQGSLTVTWPSSTFLATWRMTWAAGTLDVHAEWFDVVGSTETLLTSRPDLKIGIDDFIAEWKRPLQIIESALTAAGYDESLPGLGLLRATIANIVGEGELYRSQPI